MNKQQRLKLEKKHYERLKGFLKFDLEGRELLEQKIILEQAIKASNDLLIKLDLEK